MRVEIIKTPATAEQKRMFLVATKEAGCYFCKAKEIDVTLSLDGSAYCWCNECKGEWRVYEK